jgi:CRISPR/Cas system CSM-associated protein Csm3 (group 7 of RAMP superfamily)
MYLSSDASGLIVDQVQDFMNQIVSIVADGLPFGGNSARGVGRASLTTDSKPKLRMFDLSDIEQHGKWIDELRQLAEKTPDSGTPITPQPLDSNRLQVSFKFAIAPGQDVLVGGLNLDAVLEQQQCTAADGTEYFRIPGSSMKGIFRSWFSRLAARESLSVADNLHRLNRLLPHESDKAADPGWGFVDEATRQKWISDPSLVTCPIMKLFGSLYAKGRFRCSDSRMKKGDLKSSHRTHVSIDRISGGASEGFLFESRVLAESPTSFEFSVTIDAPTEQEARWLHATLTAIDLGVLRVGATKAAGRLQLSSKVNAVGEHAQIFADLSAIGGIK